MASPHISARAARAIVAPPIDRDEAVVASFLDDAAHVAGGFASGVSFPRTEAEVAALVAHADSVLPVGAQSSLTGGATPRGEVVLSTRALSSIDHPEGLRVRVGAGVPLGILQQALSASRLYYPPVPTYDGAFIGGTIATNASGAATFKYGSTRQWVEALTVVLASGDVLDIRRGETVASSDGWFEIAYPSGHVARVLVPSYAMPEVAKLSAGYYARPGMDLIDLFIGCEGTLGVVVSATLRVIPLPRRSVVVIRCRDDGQAIELTAVLREQASLAWQGAGPLDVAAVEYVGARALATVGDDAFARARVARPPAGSVLLLAQFEVGASEDTALSRLHAVLEAVGVTDDPVLATPDDTAGAERLFGLREAVPAAVNALVGAAKAQDGAIEKTAGDMVVPVACLADSIELYRHAFERRGLDYALWGHLSDGNLHPNVIPRSFEDVERGREALVEIAQGVVAMGGSSLAEHGVGRSLVKQRMLRDLYGADGIAQMRAVKRALDPDWTLAPGLLFPKTE